MQPKPKKALRGLFTRTEAAIELEPVVAAKPSPVIEAMPEPMIEAMPESVIEAMPASVIEVASAPMTQSVSELLRDSLPEVIIESPAEVILVDDRCDVTSPAPSMTALSDVDESASLSALVKTFTASLGERNAWEEYDYLDCIRRIDQAQTEAFLLKGKLLEEVKRRFFIDNKQGWKNFCDNRLDMNYTTANQYIRVAEEFETLARQRPDFGFEHFKALLPLPPDKRSEIIDSNASLTVKALRKMVQERLTPEILGAEAGHSSEAKSLVRSLEQLKTQITSGRFQTLPQLQRWQLAAACQNLSEELGALSGQLNTRAFDGQSRFAPASEATKSHAEERPGASVGGSASRTSDTTF